MAQPERFLAGHADEGSMNHIVDIDGHSVRAAFAARFSSRERGYQ
jgi:hypothetical protein